MGYLVKFVGPSVNEWTKLAADELNKRNAEALAKHDYLVAMLTGFQLQLDEGEAKRILLRSLR